MRIIMMLVLSIMHNKYLVKTTCTGRSQSVEMVLEAMGQTGPNHYQLTTNADSINKPLPCSTQCELLVGPNFDIVYYCE